MTSGPLEPLAYALQNLDTGRGRQFRLATVTSTTGGITVRYDGEEFAAAKQPMRVASYTAAVGHRVLLARVGSSWVILGNVTT